jgi:hypothetical protein
MRSDLAGWAQYGYCASHWRYFWGTAPAPGLHPVRASGRVRPGRRESRRAETLLDIFAAEPRLLAERPGQTLIRDKNYFGAGFQTQLAQTGAVLLRPVNGARILTPWRHPKIDPLHGC